VSDEGELAAVLAQYGLDGATTELIPGGLINRTYAVRGAGGAPVAVAQRLHPIFDPSVNLDIDAITARLAAAGLETPRPLRTREGWLWVATDGGIWRLLSWIDGVTIHRVSDPAQAAGAGAQVGAFHRALDGFTHDYAFARAGVHDTARHLARMRAGASAADPALHEAIELAAEIDAAAAGLAPLPALPLRHCHGDLKISNVLFAPGPGWRARCLIDLDTLGRQSIAFELGDGLRSWCNPAGEDTTAPAFDPAILEAALRGYASGARGLLGADEIAAIVPGLATCCIELAARFCADVFADEYFGWDATRFASRREHNLVRARGQLALGRQVLAAAAQAQALAAAAFAAPGRAPGR
jgi:Ser/Thr protein kinase RdoA (MazF antagonist)